MKKFGVVAKDIMMCMCDRQMEGRCSMCACLRRFRNNLHEQNVTMIA
jgi:hypothetical protein